MPNVRSALFGLLGSVLLLTACNQNANTSPSQAPEEVKLIAAGPAIHTLLGGLKAGDTLGPVTVQGIYAPSEGRIPIFVQKDNARGRIDIALNGDGPLPPIQTAKYSIFWGSIGTDPPLQNNLLDEACNVLAERLKATESEAPTPVGMTSYGKATTPM